MNIIETRNGDPIRLLNLESALTDPEALKIHEVNPRQGDVGALCVSFQENGFYGAVIVDKRDGRVLAGNHRVMAARHLGMMQIPVQYVETDGDIHALKVLLADNRHSDLATYDNDLLAELLQTVAAADSLLGTGYDGDDLDDLLAELGRNDEPEPSPEAEIDRADELRQKWGVEPGQLWKIGRHRLLCGDSTSADDVGRLMGGNRANICVTSPPYNAGAMEIDGQSGTGKKYRDGDDSASCAEYTQFLSACVGLMTEHADETFLNIQVLANNRASIVDLLSEFRDKFKDVIYWIKTSGAPHIQPGVMNSRAELILCIDTDNHPTRVFRRHTFSQGTFWNVIDGNNASSNEYSDIHKATFPEYLPEHIISAFSYAGDSVYEPFAGSGTTIVAAERQNRTCYAMEIDPGYVGVILERLSLMGLEPELGDA